MMFPSYFIVVWLLYSVTDSAVSQSPISTEEALDRKDGQSVVFVLDRDGHLHADDRPRQVITGNEERTKLSRHRKKRPIAEVLGEVLAEKIGVHPDTYGGSKMMLSGDTAVPDADGATLPEPRGDTGPTQRNKRQTAGGYHEVEIMMVFDYALYQFWLSRNDFSAKRAKDEMVDFYSNIVNAANGRYQTLTSPGFSVRIVVNSFIIGDSPAATPWTQTLNVSNTIDTGRALDQFARWLRTNKHTLLPFDHAMTISGYDLTSNGRAGLVGLAFQNGTCTSFSASICEALRTQETATLIAHELAHSLGSSHDGENNVCPNVNNNIMSTSISIPDRSNAANPWTFSSCTAASIKEKLARNGDQCTLRRSGHELNLQPYLREEFGQKYPHDVQCEIYRGLGSKFCRSVYFNNTHTFQDLCYSLYCYDPVEKLCFPTLAHDGTSCGNKKWCRAGRCVSSSQAPPTPENCPAGDDPDVICATNICNDVTTRDVLCCGTCKRVALPQISPPANPTPFPRIYSKNPFPPQNPFFAPNPFQPQNPFQSKNLFLSQNPFPFQPHTPFPPQNPFPPQPAPRRFNFFDNFNTRFDNIFQNLNDRLGGLTFGKK